MPYPGFTGSFTFSQLSIPLPWDGSRIRSRWNYAFLLDFPFLAIGAFLIWKYLPRGLGYLRSEKSYVDVWGAGLLIAALGSMQIALSRGERDLWFQSAFIVCFLIVALVLLRGFSLVGVVA